MIGIMNKQMADILRQKIRDSGLSANRLGKLTGVTQQAISVFLKGKDIRLETAQKLVDYFRMVLK
jgi:plasmid maintenance system antidote protein VapI